jgi:outer membrane protein, heavy metal efflux system
MRYGSFAALRRLRMTELHVQSPRQPTADSRQPRAESRQPPGAIIARVRRPFIAIACLAFSCVRYVPRPIDAAATAQLLRARTLDVAGPLTLDALTEAMWRLNADVAVARAQYASALAAVATSRERPNPSVNANLQRKNSDPGVLSPWVSNFGIDLPVEFPSKRRARVDAARENAYAALAHVGSVAWQARSRLRARMLDAWIARERQAVLSREIEIQRDIVEAFGKRVELGEAARPDLSRARIALTQTTLLMHDVKRLAAEARAGVAAAIGVPLSALGNEPLALKFDNRQPTTDNSLRDAALLARPDVVAAVHDYRSADAALRLEVARQFPDIHLQPAFGWDQGTRTWTIGGAGEIPLLNQHRGPIAEASARRDEAAARLMAIQAGVIGDFDVASAAVTAAREKLADAETLVQSEESQLATTRRQFEAGEIDRLALRSAELELETARLGRVDAEAELQQALGLVEDAIEQPLLKDER